MQSGRFSRILITSLLVAAVGAPVLAQGQRGQGRQRGARQLTIAQVPAAALEKALGLTPEQSKKIADIETKYNEETRGLRPQRGAAGGAPGPDAQANRQKLREIGDKASADIEAVLTADQKAKAPAVLKQFQALRNAGIPLEVVADLKLTPDQIIKIEKIEEESQAKIREALQGAGAGGDRQAAAQKMREMRQETQQKAQDVLTAEQKATIKKYEEANPRQQRRRPGANPP